MGIEQDTTADKIGIAIMAVLVVIGAVFTLYKMVNGVFWVVRLESRVYALERMSTSVQFPRRCGLINTSGKSIVVTTGLHELKDKSDFKVLCI